MGQDLAKRAVPSFKKGWDRERLNLLLGDDLLSLMQRAPSRVVQADLCAGASLQVGDVVLINLDEDEAWLSYKGLRVATLSGELPDLLAECGSIVAVVTDLHPEAGVVEVKTP